MADTETRDQATAELTGSAFDANTIAMAFTPALWEKWTAEVESNANYHLGDPEDPDAVKPAGLPVSLFQYGDGPNDYISTDFDGGQVVVRDGNDATGKAWKFPEEAWRRFTARLRGDEVSGDEAAEGDTMSEGAAKLAERDAERAAAEKEAADKKAGEQ